jgi:LysR family transcriptional regulator, glycine cleavage system transcriptional activator
MPMRASLLPLRAIRTFEAAARCGSFFKAAAELHVTPSAVSQQIRELELYLGMQLFVRRPKSVELSETGARYASEIRAALERISIATSRAIDEVRRRGLTISTTPSFASSWLVHRLKKFESQFPDYDVKWATSPEGVDFNRDQIDMAVQYGDGAWTGLDVEFVIRPEYCAVCSPVLLASKPLHSLDDLLHHKILRQIEGGSDLWLIHAGLPVPDPKYSDSVLLLQAARDSQGVAIVQHMLAAEDLAEGLLVEPFTTRVSSAAAYYIVTPAGGLTSSKTKAVAQWLKEEMIAGLGSTSDPPAGVSRDSYATKLQMKFGKKPVVATSVVQLANFTIKSRSDMMRRAADFHGIDLIMLDAQNNASTQASQYENFMTQQVDLILVEPVNEKSMIPVIRRINEAEIPVINYCAPSEYYDYAALVSMDWLMAGVMSGLQIVEATGGKGNVALVEGTPGFAPQFLRSRGVELVLSAYPGIKITARQTGMFNRVEGKIATEKILESPQQIDAWYFQNDEMFFGGIEAIKAAGRRDQMKIFSVDGNPEALRAIGTGDLDYEVIGAFNLQGWLILETAAKILMGEDVPKQMVMPLSMAPAPRRLYPTQAVAWEEAK